MNKILVLKIMSLLMLLIFTAAGCHLLGADSDADEMSKLYSSIAELTGGDFEVTLHEDYPLVYAYVRKPPVEVDNGSYSTTFVYREERYPAKAHLTETYIKELESHGISILYGPYIKELHQPIDEGTAHITIEYSPLFKDAWDTIATRVYETETWDVFIEYLPNGPGEIGTWDINGQEVGYAYKGEEIIDVYLQLAEAGVITTYFLSDFFTVEDAKGFTAFLVTSCIRWRVLCKA